MDEIEELATCPDVPAILHILAEVVMDKDINKLSKFKILSDYFKTSIEEEPPAHTTTLKLEIVPTLDITAIKTP